MPSTAPLVGEGEAQRHQPSDCLTGLQALTTALCGGLSVAQVAEATITWGLAALHANAGTVALLTDDGCELVVAAHLGCPPGEEGPGNRFPADAPVPLAEAVRRRRLVLETVATQQALCPQTAFTGAQAAVPLLDQDRVLGSVGLSFAAGRSISPSDLVLLQTLANLCSLAIGCARLRDTEREARRQAEKALQERQQAAAERDRLFAVGAEMLVTAGFDFRFRWVSPTWERALGWTPEELTARPFLDFIHPDDRAATLAEAGKLAEGHETLQFENRYRCKDGSYRCIRWKAKPFTAEGLIYGGATDVTEEKLALHDLRESEERFRQLAENIQAVFWMSDLQKNQILYISPAYESVWGRSCQSLHEQPLSFVDAIHPEDRGRVVALSLQRQARGEGSDVEYRVVRPDGSVRWVRDRSFPIRDSAGQAYRMAGIAVDVTDTKNDEEALRVSEERFRLFTEVMPQLVWSNLPDGTADYCNPRWLEYTGMTQAEVQGNGWMAALHPDDYAATLAAWKKALETGEEHQVEKRLRGKGGQYRWFLSRALPLRDEGGKVVKWYGTCTDIQDRKQAEEEKRLLERKLLEGQKLESLGVLAGGIAHDFNNLLTATLGYTNLIGMQLPPDSDLHEDLKKIVQVTERAADLCRQMLAYSGRGRFVLAKLDLSALVSEMLGLLQVSISKKATLQIELTAHLPPLLADATQLRQVVMNLVLNASEAIGDRSGLIRVVTGARFADRAVLDADGPAAADLPEGHYVFLEVTDTGCGMDESTRQRIFDPFFTTKFTGRGLGLAAVLGIIRGHKGAIQVESEPGRGSLFRLLLPGGKEEGEQQQHPPTSSVPWQGEGTVLVADDESCVRDVAAQMLRMLGFRVIPVADGEMALASIRELAEEIRLVLLDLTMPRLDGAETFRTIRMLRPGLPVILMSGFSEQEASSRFAGKGLAGFLAKPFSLEDLAVRVRAALEQPVSLPVDE
jgi:PAS domain S-box-containing protein